MKHNRTLLLTLIVVAGCGSTATEPSKDADMTKNMAAFPTAQGPVRPPVPETRPSDVVRPVPVPTTRPGDLKFSKKSIDAIVAGTKTATVRKGIRTAPMGPMTVRTDDATVVVQVTKADHKKLADLTAADAADEGSGSVDALKAQLAKDYPGIGPDDEVTVLRFKVVR